MNKEYNKQKAKMQGQSKCGFWRLVTDSYRKGRDRYIPYTLKYKANSPQNYSSLKGFALASKSYKVSHATGESLNYSIYLNCFLIEILTNNIDIII